MNGTPSTESPVRVEGFALLLGWLTKRDFKLNLLVQKYPASPSPTDLLSTYVMHELLDVI